MDDKTKNDGSGAFNVIGQRLKYEMKKKGVSSAELAARAEVKTSFLYDIISGKSTNPSSVKLARVADCLGISLAYLADSGDRKPMSAFGDYVPIGRLAVEASLPQPQVMSSNYESEPFIFRKAWVIDGLRLDPEKLRVLPMHGDSMEPTLYHDDLLLVDTAQIVPTPPGIFVMFDGFGLAVKRMESHALQPNVRIISDNPYYTNYECLLAETSIIGRVVWFGRAI